MGSFEQLVSQNLEQMDQEMPKDSLTEKLLEMKYRLENLEESQEANETTAILNSIYTTIGYLNQLSFQIEDPSFQSLMQEVKSKKQTFLEQIHTKEAQENSTQLKEIENKITNYYQETKKKASKQIEEGLAMIQKRKKLLNQVEKIVHQIDQMETTSFTEIQQQQLTSLAELYAKVLKIDENTLEGVKEEMDLLQKIDELGTPFLKTESKEIKKTSSNEKTVSLFSDINDQIIEVKQIFQDGKYYIRYTLEDGTYYFAVVEDQIDSIYNNFEQLSVLSHEQSLQAWKDNLEVILYCLGVYYQIEEYTRYQEVSNRKAMTQEILLEIEKYRKIVSFLRENLLKQYLEYAKVLGEKAFVGENQIENIYPELNQNKTTQEQAKYEILCSILNINQEQITMEQLRKSLYVLEEEKILKQIEETEPIEKQKESQIPPVEPLPIPIASKDIPPTNYDLLDTYFENQKDPSSYREENQYRKARKEDVLYQDVNTYLDLEYARQVTNLLYQEKAKGQGDYAKLRFLKDGRLEAFTSKNEARNTAALVNRNDYFYLMLTQAIKDYATFNEQRKQKPNFGEGMESLFSLVGQAVLEENFNGEELTKQILQEDSLLTSLAKNFDGRYLIQDKKDSLLFDQVLRDYQIGNPIFAEKVTNALSSLHQLYKQNGYEVPKKSETESTHSIPSIKMAA